MKVGEFQYVSQKEFWDFLLNEDDAADLLKYDISAARRKALFKKYVSVIVLETSSYCNRFCSYCPVAGLDKKSKEFIRDDHFDILLNDLQDLDYDKIITLNLFNEPLAAAKPFIEKVRLIKQACPKSYIRINSNGDYLNQPLLSALAEAGLSEMLVTMHIKPDEVYDDEIQRSKLDQFLAKLSLDKAKQLQRFEPGENITYEVFWQEMRILAVSNNWGEYGNDRGGTVESLTKEQRTTPCLVPFREIVVDYNGMVAICWNVFRNISNSIGQIGANNLLDVYFDKPAVDLRKEMLVDGPKEGIHKTCNVPSYTSESTSQKRQQLLEQAQWIPLKIVGN